MVNNKHKKYFTHCNIESDLNSSLKNDQKDTIPHHCLNKKDEVPKKKVREDFDNFQIEKQIEEQITDSYQFFDIFIKNLKSLLFKYKFISKETILQAQTFLKTNIYSLRGDRKRLSSPIKEWILDKWFGRIINEIDFSKKKKKADIKKRFKKLFLDYYEKCGYSQDNYFYRPFKILLSRIGDVLVLLGIIADNNDDRIVKSIGIDFRGTIYDLRNNPNLKITSLPLRNIKSKLIKTLEKQFLLKKNVCTKQDIQIFKEILVNFIDTFINKYKLQDFSLLDKLRNHQSSYSSRNNLLQNIVKKCTLLNNLESISTFSILLFGNQDYITQKFLFKYSIGNKPELYVLFRMIGYSLIWNVQNFKKFGLDIDRDILLIYRTELQNVIKNFVFYGKYSSRYIAEHPKRGELVFPKEFLMLEYDTILSLWSLCAVLYENFSITFADVKRLYNLGEDPTQYLIEGKYNIGYNLKRIYIKTKNLLEKVNINQPYKLFSYSEKNTAFHYTLFQILRYSKIRGVRVIPAKWDVYRIFNDSYVLAYHVISLLKRNLGFDIFHFIALEDNIFLNAKFVRHHFKYKDFRVKFKSGELKSSLVKDILLTSNTFHSSYRSYERVKKGEVKIEKILTGFEILMNYNGKINDFVIKKVFKKLEENWVYYKWKSQGEVNFKKMINIFNERKHYLKDHTTMKFLQKYYHNAFFRFYNKFVHTKRNMSKFSFLLDDKILDKKI